MSGSFPKVGDTFGRYEITERVGHGGMGVVFAARERGLGRTVALKVLSPVFAEEAEFRARFVREAALLASVDSPHIIAIYDQGEQDGCLYIATQLVPGGDLGARLQQGPLLPEQALAVAAQLASALSDAHLAGVVHRDVKPSNVLLRETSRLHAYVCDFGVARGHEEGLTRTGAVIGSVAYMSPEQCLGEVATPASDLYALGCLLVALLTGSPPFQGPDVEVAQGHLHAQVPRLAEGRPGWSGVDRVLGQALAKDPSARYPSATAMEADLVVARRELLGEPHAAPVAPAQGPVDATALRPVGHSLTGGTRGTAPLDEPLPASRRRAGLVGGLVLALLVAGLAGVAGIALSRGDRHRPTGQRAVATPTAAAKTCWDGSSVDFDARCDAPEGLGGMRYVFPSFARAYGRGDCASKPGDLAAPGKTDSWACPVRVPSGAEVQVVYGAWRSWRAAEMHYAAKYAADGVRDGRFLVFGPSSVGNTRGALQSARLLSRTYGFSVTVIARSDSDVSAAMRTVRARAPEDIPT